MARPFFGAQACASDRDEDRAQPRQQVPPAQRLRSCARPSRRATRHVAQTAYRATVSVVDKGVQKGVLHKNTASRYKARLNARVKAVRGEIDRIPSHPKD